jgi:hypothetical protein
VHIFIIIGYKNDQGQMLRAKWVVYQVAHHWQLIHLYLYTDWRPLNLMAQHPCSCPSSIALGMMFGKLGTHSWMIPLVHLYIHGEGTLSLIL